MIFKPIPLYWLSDARGVHIPRDFAQSFSDEQKARITGVSADQWGVLACGANERYYWDVWIEVLDNAVITDRLGNKFTLYQDGDLWLIPDGMIWSDEKDFFVWPALESCNAES